MTANFEPSVVGFFCNWCSYRAADGAGMARLKYPAHIRIIRVMCSGRVDPAFVLKALAGGADGVLIAGCHPGECHYVEQNYKTLRRVALLHKTLESFGIETDRVKLLWASASEGPQLAQGIESFVDTLRQLGPLHWADQRVERRASQEALDALEREHATAMEVPV